MWNTQKLLILSIVFIVTTNLSSFAIAVTNPQLISTFNCISIYWAPNSAIKNEQCEILYRESNTSNWKKAISPIYDKEKKTYRGSIVNLRPNTEYEILLVRNNNSITCNQRTLNDQFVSNTVVYLPPFMDRTLEINKSGSEDNYIKYSPTPKQTTIINVDNRYNSCIDVKNSHHVIISNLILKGAIKNAIILGPNAHDIVIENCDISEWGQKRSNRYGRSGEAGIRSLTISGASNVYKITIQQNRIHHPRFSTNSWVDPVAGSHPNGPMAIFLPNTLGNHIIRYNSIYSDEEHLFEDGIGGWGNHGYKGFPNKDSDIYGNYIAECNDDAIQAEGANSNVRIWGNFINNRHHAIGTAVTSVGPLYIFRNISKGHDSIRKWSGYHKGGFIKTTSRGVSGGKIYIIHNTMLSPPNTNNLMGSETGIGSGYNGIKNVFSRNNILQVTKNGISIFDRDKYSLRDYDFDLYNGPVVGEKNGIKGEPTYSSKSCLTLSKKICGTGVFTLEPGSKGFDCGEEISNFNDNFSGKGPDVGAAENGSLPMKFGAYTYK